MAVGRVKQVVRATSHPQETYCYQMAPMVLKKNLIAQFMNVTKRMFVQIAFQGSKVAVCFFFLLSFEKLSTGCLSDEIIPVEI